MEIDSLLEFEHGAPLTTTRDTPVLDFLADGDEIAKTMSLCVQAHGLAASGSVNIQVSVRTSSNSEDWTTIATFADTAYADANATGFIVKHGIIPYGIKRYLKVTYTVTTGPLTGGTVDTFLTRSRDIR